MNQDSIYGFYPSFGGQVELGVNLKFMDGNLKVKPQIGITNGALLSGSQTDGVPPGSEQTVDAGFGPQVRFSLLRGFFARFSAGSYGSDHGTGDFYKLTLPCHSD